MNCSAQLYSTKSTVNGDDVHCENAEGGCWATVGVSWGGSDRLVAALSQGAPTMCCGWKPMLARCRSTAAMVTAVMVSRVSSGGPEVGGGCRGVKWVPDLEECDVWVRHLAIRGGKGVISLSVDCTA